MKPTLLILAAGMGSRYGGLKQIEPFGPSGETILEYSVFDAIRAGFGHVVFVIRENFADAFMSRFEPKLKGKIKASYVYQELDRLPEGYVVPEGREKPWGTSHAILMAREIIKEPFAVINADDFYGAPAFQAISSFLRGQASASEFAMPGYRLENVLSRFGSVSRGVCKTGPDGYLDEIVERTKIMRNGNDIVFTEGDKSTVLDAGTPVSMNFWGFHPVLFDKLEVMFKAFLDTHIDRPKSEFYIPSAVSDLIRTGETRVKVLATDSPWFGITYPEDKPYAVERIRQLVREGDYPGALWK